MWIQDIKKRVPRDWGGHDFADKFNQIFDKNTGGGGRGHPS